MFNRKCARVTYASPSDVPGHVACQPSVMSVLLNEECLDLTDQPAVRIRTDNYLVLHQKDLENRIGVDNVRRILNAMNQNSARDSDYQKALDKLSDQQLLSLVRSRHLQSPGELKEYAVSILQEASMIEKQYGDLLVQNAQIINERLKQQQKPDVEPPKTE